MSRGGGGGSVSRSCLTLVTPWTSPPGSSVHGILQARILECVAIPFSRGSSLPSEPPEKLLLTLIIYNFIKIYNYYT